jgi:hypothetical protein
MDALRANDPDGGSEDGACDFEAMRLLANYGLWRRTTVSCAVTYGDREFGGSEPTILTAGLSLKRNLIHRRRGLLPKLAVDAGLRADMVVGKENILFNAPAGAAQDDEQRDRVKAEDLADTTFYARLTAGEIFGRFFPHLFFEYGHTDIDGRAEPESAENLSEFSLNRGEDYVKTGVSLMVKFPYKALLHLEYDYLYLFRDRRLDALDDNHILKAEFTYYLTPHAALNIGGQYAAGGLNGRIPFLYQHFNQESFGRECSRVQAGLTFLFGG